MKRTNVVLDERKVARGKRATGIKTTRALIDHALDEVIRLHRQGKLLQLRGKIDWQGDLADMRRGREFP